MVQGAPAARQGGWGSLRAAAAAALALWLASPAVAGAAPAAGEEPPPSGFTADLWRVGEGVPGPVTALLHAPDGYLWVGTLRGLVRFDGVRFTPLPLLAAERPLAIHALAPDGAGGVWIASDQGLIRAERGAHRLVAAGVDCLSLLLTRDGVLLVGTRRGLARLAGERLEPVPGPDTDVEALAEEPDGHVLVGSDSGLWRYQHGVLAVVPPAAGGTDRTVRALAPAAGGGTWMGFVEGLRLVQPLGRSVESPRVEGLPATNVLALAVDASGRLWLGTFAGGLQRLSKDQARASARAELLSKERVEALLAEPDGSLWVGSHAGLERLRTAPIRLLQRRDGLSAEVSWSAYADPKDGAIWVGLDGAGVDRIEGERIERYTTRWGLEGETVTAMLRSTDGDFWIGARNRGLVRVTGGRARELPAPDGGRFARVRGLLQAEDGAVWIGHLAGVTRLQGGRLRDQPLAQPLQAWNLAEGPGGVIWAGGNRLARLVPPDFTEDTPAPLAAIKSAVDLLPDGADLWIVSYSGGLHLWHDGVLTSLATLDRRFEGEAVALLPDDEGRLWFAREGGLLVVPRHELRALATQGRPLRTAIELGPRDGLVSTGVNTSGQSPAATGRDGRLWFASSGGVTVVDPRWLRTPIPTPAPLVEAAFVDGGPAPLAAGGLDIDHGAAALELQYTSPSLAAPHRLRFRHRLEGWDAGWVDGGAQRSAFFRGLREGRYRFAVQVSRDGGPWIDGAAPLAVTVRLRPLERRWVLWLLGAGGLGLLAAGGVAVTRVRERRLRARAAELGQLVEARTRELAAARDELEVRVLERTARLQEELERRDRLERQLADVQKLDSVGRLAGGVAHDLNNLLTVVLGCASSAQYAPNLPAEVAQDLAEIDKAGKRAAALTRQLLAFARRQRLEVRRLDLRAVLHDVDSLLRRVLGPGVALSCEVPDGPCPVQADSAQLEQVLVNLAVNAADAMPEGGSLRLSAGRARLEADDGGAHPGVAAGEYVRLLVADTGSGMSEEVQRHLFEPFFTTKPQGKGTGLGLATCYGIVKQLGGHVWVRSAPGQGTTFTIHLPLAEGPLEAAEPRAAPAAAGGKEQVLLVEDEPQLLALAARALRDRGYRVVTASDGQEALDVVATLTTPLDLLVTDVVMPRLGGPELAVRLRGRLPGLRVLFLSGYAEGISTPAGRPPPGAAFMPKPYTPLELAAKVRQLLDAPPT